MDTSTSTSSGLAALASGGHAARADPAALDDDDLLLLHRDPAQRPRSMKISHNLSAALEFDEQTRESSEIPLPLTSR